LLTVAGVSTGTIGNYTLTGSDVGTFDVGATTGEVTLKAGQTILAGTTKTLAVT